MSYTNGLDNPTDYFNSVLWTGNNTARTITGVNFQPDFVWIKRRSASSDHLLYDVIRGVQKTIKSNSTDAENTLAQGLTAFASDGFSIGTDGDINNNTSTYIGWNWKAGTSFSNDASATGIGTIDSSGSFNNDSGFSIVSYTGTGSAGTIKHGLNTAPSMILLKKRGGGANWMIWHQSLNLSDGQFMEFNNNAQQSSGTAVWDVSEMSSTNIGIGTNGDSNGSSATYIAYCFAEKQGYSKVGSYTGNGDSDGTFVFCGFRPAWVMFKRTNDTGNWQLLDNKRTGFNPENHTLYPNSNHADQDETDADIFSNGFKLTNTGTDGNGSGSTYIYMAFAEAPFVNSNGVPCNAR